MPNKPEKRSLIKFLLQLCLVIGMMFFTCSSLTAQSAETEYFVDVTDKYLPIDPEAHILDEVMVDADSDGDLDLILALESDVNRLYINDGNGKMIWKKDVFENAKHDTEHVRVADFDHDGILDVIFVAEDDQNHEYYLGNGDATFKNVSERLLAKSEGNALDVGDVNGDSLPDIVVGNSGTSGQNYLWINNKEKPGFFIDFTEDGLPQINDGTQSIKLADLDADGDLDMVVGNEIPPNRLLLNNGIGVFREASNQLKIDVPLHTREALVFDADNDGKPDIIFANLTNNGGNWDKDPRTRLLINNGKAIFTDQTLQKMPSNKFSTYAGAAIDYDQDGDLDLLMSAIKIPSFEAMQMHLYENDGRGNFIDVSQNVIPATTAGRTWGIAIGDVNGDGINDAFVGGWGTQARLLLGKLHH